MSHCIVPNWNVSHQRQDINQGEEGNRSSHVALSNHFQQQLNHQSQSLSHQLVPMSNFDEVTELTWENGQLTMHELGGIFSAPTISTTTSALPKATWGGGAGRASDTLESIVHQATYYNPEQTPNLLPDSAHQHSGHQSREKVGSSVVASCSRKWDDDSRHIQPTGGLSTPPSLALMKKRTRAESENFAPRNNTNDHDISMCASANAVFCNKDDNNNNNDATMMTWTSFDSPRSCTRTKTSTDEDSACHGGSENQEEDQKTKGESGRSYTARKGRAAAVHNQSERRRRDRINQKMKALQKLVPNASKTDKASMLDEVIEYLKQLQAQVQMMTSARFMPQLMMPLGMQQQLHQMSLMARVGMGANLGMGIGMLDATTMKGSHPGSQAISGIIHPNQIATAASTFAPPTFVVPQMITAVNHQPNSVDPSNNNSAALQDPYSALLAQSMNMELYSRMAALQRQQQQTSSQHTSSQLQ